jgi:hypothetical protein
MSSVFVQWKGTDVCLDLNCLCGYHGHFDGDFAYFLRCGSCGRTYEMPHTFEVTPDETPEDDGPTRDVFAAERCPEPEGPKVVKATDGLDDQQAEGQR